MGTASNYIKLNGTFSLAIFDYQKGITNSYSEIFLFQLRARAIRASLGSPFV